MAKYSLEFGDYIPNGAINSTIADWQAKRPDREQNCATPSSLMDCPRLVWLKYKHKVPPTNIMGWGKKQRFLLGRQLESMIAGQLQDEGLLLHWWKDDNSSDSEKFEHGEGLDKITGTPDLLLRISDKVAISDSKTSRSDSFKYVPIEPDEIWQDPYWHKYKLQLTAYYMLCHWNEGWFARTLLDDQPAIRKFGEGPATLPLPEVCHLFSYSLDDGIVRREIIWTPTKEDAELVNKLTRRWNSAYVAEEMPDCTCVADGTVLFCPYAVMEPGKKVASVCCNDNLIKEVENGR